MAIVYLSLFILVFLSDTSSAVNVDNIESNKKPNEKPCGVKIGCYNASVIKPRCGNGNVTFSPDLKYTAEFELTGCDGRRIGDVPVSWREIVKSADDNEIVSCRNQYQCLIPTEMIRKRTGNPLVLEIWTSIAPVHRLVRLAIILHVRPPAQDKTHIQTSKNALTQTLDSVRKASLTQTNLRTEKAYTIRKARKRPSKSKTYEDLVLDNLASSSQMTSQGQKQNNKDDRLSQKTGRSGTTRNDYRWFDGMNVIKTKPGSQSQQLGTQKLKSREDKTGTSLNSAVDTEVLVLGSVGRKNVSNYGSSLSDTSLNNAKSKHIDKSRLGRVNKTILNTSYRSKTVKPHNNAKTTANLSIQRKPSSLNITLSRHGAWHKGGKSKIKIHKKMKISMKLNGTVSDASTALDSILSSQKGEAVSPDKYSNYELKSKSGKNDDTRAMEHLHPADKLLYKCVELFCGKQRKTWRCPKILVLQCLHLSASDRRQSILGDIREEMQQLLDMFNVSRSDLKEIEKAAKASARHLMEQKGNMDILSKNIGTATGEILMKLYNTSYLASRAAMTERFGETGKTTQTDSVPASGFGEWSEWSQCSVSCGTGQTMRLRVCPSKAAGCLTKPSHESKTCKESACPQVHPQLPIPWSSWSSCSVTCGLGQETRSRSCAGGTGQKTDVSHSRERCNGTTTVSRLCIMSTCNTDSNSWRKTVLLGYDTVLRCGLSTPRSLTQTYWITPGGSRVSQGTHLPRMYQVGDTLVIHRAQKSDEGVYHCIFDQNPPSKVVTTDTRIEVLTCSSVPCENGGTCKEQTYGFHSQLRQVTCSCRMGYQGRHCQDHVTTHSNFRLYVLIACLIGLLVSCLLGFLVYLCAYRKTNQDKPKKSKKNEIENKPGDKPQMLGSLAEEGNTSVDLDTSIVNSDDSWIQISEKDYRDFQEQTASNLYKPNRPVSRSLPALNSLSTRTPSLSSYPAVQRKSVSNTETRTQDQFGDMQPESKSQPHGYAYEVPTSPEIKSKILLVQPDRKAKSSPDFKTKKTVSFQVQGLSQREKNALNEEFKPTMNGSAHQSSFTYKRSRQASATKTPHQMSSTASSAGKLSSTSPAKQMSKNSYMYNMTPLSETHHSENENDYFDMSGAHQSGNNDFPDKSGGHQTENELVIVTSDSILGLPGNKTNRALGGGIEFDHKQTFSPHEKHPDSKMKDNVKQYEDNKEYTPVYYTYQPSPADKDDLYVDMCEFVHKNTYFPQENVQQAQSEHLYVNLIPKSDIYPGHYVASDKQTKHFHPESNMSQTTSQEDCGLTATNVATDMDDISSNPGDVFLKQETNSSNHSYTDDQNKQEQSDSEQLNISTCSDRTGRTESQEMDPSQFCRQMTQSTSYEEDDQCYESDQSSTLCPMPDLDVSDFIDDGSWETTLKEGSFNKTDDSAEEFRNVVNSFNLSKSFDTKPGLDAATTLPNETDGMASAFDVSLGDLLNEVDNDILFGQSSSENDKVSDCSSSSCSNTDHRVTEARDIPDNDRPKTEMSHHVKSTSSFDNDTTGIKQQPNPSPSSSPRTRMCRGHYEMVYGPVSYPSPIIQLDSKPSTDDQRITTEVENLPLQAYPVEHYYSSKSNSDVP